MTYDPPRNGSTSPAMIAEIKPQIGGAPDATAMPSEKGSETSETTSPASRSWRQCFRPARPFSASPGRGGTDLHGISPFCLGRHLGEVLLREQNSPAKRSAQIGLATDRGMSLAPSHDDCLTRQVVALDLISKSMSRAVRSEHSSNRRKWLNCVQIDR